MLRWLKAWRELARLRAESKRLAQEIERTAGELPKLPPKELRRLARQAKGMSPRAIRKHSSLHPDDVETIIKLSQSAENR